MEQDAPAQRDVTGTDALDNAIGVLIAIVSSLLGGSAAAVTRYLVGNADPITLAMLRWGIGFVIVLPAAVLMRAKWPPRRDWMAVAILGTAFFGLFFYNVALGTQRPHAQALRCPRCRSRRCWSERRLVSSRSHGGKARVWRSPCLACSPPWPRALRPHRRVRGAAS